MSDELSYAAHVLDEAYDRLKDNYVSSSVLGPVRLYSAKDSVDRELWALFCALVDFQMPVISALNPMLTGLAKHIEERDLKFVDLIHDLKLAERVLEGFEWSSPRGPKRGFVHRFVKVKDVIGLLSAFKRLCDVYGSLRGLAEKSYAEHANDPEPVEGVVRDLQKALLEYGGSPPLVPSSASSCLKRLNLFLRWLVRPYPDLGLWDFVDKRHLLASLDQNLKRVLSRAFGVNVGLNWCGVLKATRFLRKLNPKDPTKYDYVLSRISIMGYCAKDVTRSSCFLCPIASVCRTSRLPEVFMPKPLTKREMEIFEEYLKVHRGELDLVSTEYQLGRYSADALLHTIYCEEYVVEVEEELNYSAIGQAITYRHLYYKLRGRVAKPMIICRKASRELKEAAWLEQGITVVVVS